MEEENKVIAAEETVAEAPVQEAGNEPHGSASAPRNNDRKDAGARKRPGERRGGRGGFRQNPHDDGMAERVVAINRVSKTTKGSKNVRFSALTVIGDGKGKYGFASAKSGEVPDAIKKSLTAARKHLYSVKLVKGTIAHDIEGSFGSTKVVLKPAGPGTGIVAGGAVRAVVELAGIRNVVSKVYGSRNAHNVVLATSACLQSLKEYDKVMILRGLKTPEQIKAKNDAMKAQEAPKGDK